jgi:hypothetical protein
MKHYTAAYNLPGHSPADLIITTSEADARQWLADAVEHAADYLDWSEGYTVCREILTGALDGAELPNGYTYWIHCQEI